MTIVVIYVDSRRSQYVRLRFRVGSGKGNRCGLENGGKSFKCIVKFAKDEMGGSPVLKGLKVYSNK